MRRRRSLSIPTVCVHRRSGEQVSGTLVLTILHRERTNKVFWEALVGLLLLTFTMGHLPSKSGGATSWRIRSQLLRTLPSPLIDDLVPAAASSPSASSSPATPFLLQTKGTHHMTNLLLSSVYCVDYNDLSYVASYIAINAA